MGLHEPPIGVKLNSLQQMRNLVCYHVTQQGPYGSPARILSNAVVHHNGMKAFERSGVCECARVDLGRGTSGEIENNSFRLL